jgi:DNA-binding response OmpR family regulator
VSRAKLRKLFEAAGFEVDLASDGEEALERIGSKPYAVLITDLEMPKVDGFQVIAAVQDSLDTEDLPIIAITGHEELSARVHDMQGLYGIFRKPWNDRELLKRVAAVSTLRRQAAAGNG